MRTIKLVIIGSSGTGKTSIRTQYIAGRFSTSYKATIGADFFARTLPHHRIPGEQVSLQIWDTAGQERFSSLSKAFFRGADAVLLVFDVNQPETLHALRNWWSTFRDYAPVPDDETYNFCTVVVGNKTDLIPATLAAGKPVVSPEETQAFVDELFPPPPRPPTPEAPEETPSWPSLSLENGEPDMATLVRPARSDSIDIRTNGRLHQRLALGSRATSRSSRFGGTVNTSRTGFSVYHTPSSSYFDDFVSAPSSPPSPFGSPRPTHSRKRTSHSSLSSSVTVRPSDDDLAVEPEPPDDEEPEVGPRVFFTSAKSGERVSDVFTYVARRVVARWEWDETHVRDSLIFSESDSDETVRLSASHKFQQRLPGCCT